jgi:methyl-accepting chemotaxis protein
MDGITQQNAALVEQASAASQSLSELAKDLTHLVSRFKIDDSKRSLAERDNSYDDFKMAA